MNVDIEDNSIKKNEMYIENTEDIEDENGNREFVLSLLPLLRTLPTETNLEKRIEIRKLLEEAVEANFIDVYRARRVINNKINADLNIVEALNNEDFISRNVENNFIEKNVCLFYESNPEKYTITQVREKQGLFNLNWNSDEVKNYIYCLYSEYSLSSIGFKYAICDIKTKQVSVINDNEINTQQLLKDTTRTDIFIIPNKNLPSLHVKPIESLKSPCETTCAQDFEKVLIPEYKIKKEECDVSFASEDDDVSLQNNDLLNYDSSDTQFLDVNNLDNLTYVRSNDVYTCQVCKLTFLNESSYEKHLENHKVQGENSLDKYQFEGLLKSIKMLKQMKELDIVEIYGKNEKSKLISTWKMGKKKTRKDYYKLESIDKILARRAKNAESMRKRRSAETVEEAAARRKADAERKRQRRKAESEQEAALRRALDAERKRQRRLTHTNIIQSEKINNEGFGVQI